jgi:uncharacterized membrane protein YdjX (TVP38/TMEM64 family)
MHSRRDRSNWAHVRKLLAALVVIVVLGVAHRLGVLATFAEPSRIKDALVGLGPLGGLVYVAAFTVLQPFGIPGTVFIVAAPLVWPWPVAFALSMVATMAASVVGFSFARYVGRDFFRERVFTRFARYEEAVETRAFATVFVLRFVFWTHQCLHVLFGVSSVRFSTHFWASLAAYTLPIFLLSYFGRALLEGLRTLSPSAWLVIGATAAAVILAIHLLRKWRANVAAPESG